MPAVRSFLLIHSLQLPGYWSMKVGAYQTHGRGLCSSHAGGKMMKPVPSAIGKTARSQSYCFDHLTSIFDSGATRRFAGVDAPSGGVCDPEAICTEASKISDVVAM